MMRKVGPPFALVLLAASIATAQAPGGGQQLKRQLTAQ
jgi:hypothetical protein